VLLGVDEMHTVEIHEFRGVLATHTQSLALSNSVLQVLLATHGADACRLRKAAPRTLFNCKHEELPQRFGQHVLLVRPAKQLRCAGKTFAAGDAFVLSGITVGEIEKRAARNALPNC
jgi:hypothetical protein